MNGPDIDGTLPGQETEEESSEDEIRRESDSGYQSSESPKSWDGAGDGHGWREEESLRGWFYFTAGACSGLLVVYLILVLYYEFDIPYLYKENSTNNQKKQTDSSHYWKRCNLRY